MDLLFDTVWPENTPPIGDPIFTGTPEQVKTWLKNEATARYLVWNSAVRMMQTVPAYLTQAKRKLTLVVPLVVYMGEDRHVVGEADLNTNPARAQLFPGADFTTQLAHMMGVKPGEAISFVLPKKLTSPRELVLRMWVPVKLEDLIRVPPH